MNLTEYDLKIKNVHTCYINGQITFIAAEDALSALVPSLFKCHQMICDWANERKHNTYTQIREKEEQPYLYEITTDSDQLYLGWTSPSKAGRILAEYKRVFPAARIKRKSDPR